jgi:hypothetical protein
VPAGLEQALGLLVVLVVLADVLLTVLYARAGTGFLSAGVTRLTWAAFRRAARGLAPGREGAVLAFCGPAVLVLLVLAWALALTLGAALVMRPELGGTITAQSGETPTGFAEALYAAGSSMSIVGSGDLVPRTDATRLLYLFNSLVGMSVVSLTLTYVMQVYSALQQRNALALKVHLLTAQTGDAAELLARLGPRGEFSAGYTDLSDLAAEMIRVKEAHHFYSVLFYFRFREPHYAVSRFALVALDATALVECALDDRRHGWLKESAAVEQLRRASELLVQTLEQSFLGGTPDPAVGTGQPGSDRLRTRYDTALARLRRAGIETTADEPAGCERYVALRSRWEADIARLAPAMAYSLEEIDAAGRGAAAANAPRARTAA